LWYYDNLSVGDSSIFSNVYTERSLNIRMNYPQGWIFVDQHKNDIFEGVIFILNEIGNSGNNPFISLYLKNKSFFSESKYKYKISYLNFDAYFNDEEKIGSKVIQEVYIRTNDDFDFIFKLQVSDIEDFKVLQSYFFYMLKSFNFRKGIF